MVWIANLLAAGLAQRVLYAEKLDPHPQELVAFGFLKTNPRPITSSLKSICAPLRYRYDFISHTILTPFDSKSSSLSAGSSSTRSNMYAKPEQPPPLTPT